MDESAARTRHPDHRALFMAAPTPCLALAPDAPRFTILEANDAFLRAAARRRQDLVGRALAEAWPGGPEDAAAPWGASLGRVLTTRAGDSATAEMGRRRWRVTHTPALDGNGEVAAILHQAEDVTDAAPTVDGRRFRALFEQSVIGVALVDLSGRWTDVNGRLAGMLGYDDPGELVGRTVAETTHPADREGDEAFHRATDAGEAPTRREKRCLRRDGGALWVAVTAALVRGAAGQALHRLALVEDIGECVAEEARLRENEAFHRLTAEAGCTGAWSLDVASSLCRLSPMMAELAGFPPDRLTVAAKECCAVIHPDDLAGYEVALKAAVAHDAPLDVEFRVRAGDGWRWLHSQGRLVRGASGAPLRLEGASTDVSRRRTAEDELRRTSELLRLIGDSAPDLIYAKDRDSRMLYANAAFQRAAGRNADGLIGRLEADWTTDQAQAETFVANDRRVIESGVVLDTEEAFTDPRGRTRHFRSVKAPLRETSGRVIGLVGVSSDVTGRREAEERERMLAREVDHRAKNMLMVVQSVVQLSRAEDAAALKAAVTGRIQSLARAHSLLAAARWEGVELRDLVAEELAPFAERAAEAVRMEGPALRLRPAAAQALALVLHELATNALKHGAASRPEGRVEIVWRRARGSEEDGGLELDWRERGGPRVAPPDRRGFGATVIQTSVERQLGGAASFDWRETGLVCAIVLPAKHLAPGGGAEARRKAEHPPAPGAGSLRGRRILVVEDEALIALQIEDALKAAGCTVVGPAASVAEAARLIEAAAPEAALLDVNLGPERSDAVADVLAARGTRFAFCTGYAGAAELPERHRGATVLAKPITPAALTRALERLFAAAPPPTA